MPPHQQVAHPQYMAAAAVAHQRNMPPVNDPSLRRSRKPTEKNMPEGLEDIVIGDGLQEYKRLRDIEKRLDSTIVRKRLDVQDSVSRTMKRYRTLRIWISNTTENQTWQKGEQSGNGGPGSGRYKVRIEGRLLDDENSTISDEDSDDEEDEEGKENGGPAEGQDSTNTDKLKKQQRPRQRLSHFFKSITVDFDKTPNSKPEDVSPITWTKPQLPLNVVSLPPSADFDSVQFSRGAHENVNITISLVRDEQPERLRVSKELADVIDVEEESRSGIILGIWDYVRAMGLQEDQEKRQVRCDARLKKVNKYIRPIPNPTFGKF